MVFHTPTSWSDQCVSCSRAMRLWADALVMVASLTWLLCAMVLRRYRTFHMRKGGSMELRAAARARRRSSRQE
eukprot:224847-Pyramimonas_sp.AAC.1